MPEERPQVLGLTVKKHLVRALQWVTRMSAQTIPAGAAALAGAASSGAYASHPQVMKLRTHGVRGIRLAGALVAMAALSSCGFSARLPWFDACQDIDQIEPTQATAPVPSVVFEQTGSIKVMEGVTRATSLANRLLRVEQGVDLPAYANQATVFLNGWQAAYNDSDHHLYDVAAILGRIQVIPGQKISWNAIGDLADYDADETFTWTYRYTIIAWNDAVVRAVVDHNDAEHYCKSKEADGDDNFFAGENTDSNATTALASFPSFLRNGGFAGGRQVAVLPRGFVFSWSGAQGGDDHHLLQLAYNRGARRSPESESAGRDE